MKVAPEDLEVPGSEGGQNRVTKIDWIQNHLPGAPLVVDDHGEYANPTLPNVVNHREWVSRSTRFAATTRLAPSAGARVLLDAGAEVDPLNKFGDTPLIKAVRKRHASTAAVLLEAGANQAWRDDQGYQVCPANTCCFPTLSSVLTNSKAQRSTEGRKTRNRQVPRPVGCRKNVGRYSWWQGGVIFLGIHGIRGTRHRSRTFRPLFRMQRSKRPNKLTQRREEHRGGGGCEKIATRRGKLTNTEGFLPRPILDLQKGWKCDGDAEKDVPGGSHRAFYGL